MGNKLHDATRHAHFYGQKFVGKFLTAAAMPELLKNIELEVTVCDIMRTKVKIYRLSTFRCLKCLVV